MNELNANAKGKHPCSFTFGSELCNIDYIKLEETITKLLIVTLHKKVQCDSRWFRVDLVNSRARVNSGVLTFTSCNIVRKVTSVVKRCETLPIM